MKAVVDIARMDLIKKLTKDKAGLNPLVGMIIVAIQYVNFL
ncbi:hypothetical protein [Gaetbulibacter aestuarii]|uniref:Uncharacterized protein n=1 Tax=Gaetbulibacter aestuarii TaxID=1502358 RepID=A0ABW7N2L7_9FLAO